MKPLDPPQRLLCGPGPTNVEPAALQAMAKPMLGHLDPEMPESSCGCCASCTATGEVSVLPLQATGTSIDTAGRVFDALMAVLDRTRAPVSA